MIDTKGTHKKSFHADTYCFDSIPEKECFMINCQGAVYLAEFPPECHPRCENS